MIDFDIALCFLCMCANPPNMISITVLFLFCEFVEHSCHGSFSLKDFEEDVHAPDFIDKTLFIKEFFTANKTLFIAAPVGFGKTFNLVLLKHYLSLDKTSGERLFNHTDIFKEENLIRDQQGNYTVIYCTFSQKYPVYDYRSLLNAFRKVVFKTFALHPYLRKSKKISSFDKKMLTFYTGVKKHLSLTAIQIVRALHFLSRLLKSYHEKDVILMIDEYDALILNCIFSKGLRYDTVLGFHNAFFSGVLHENEYITRAIMMGTTCTCVKSLVHLREFDCVGFLQSENFSPFFGITQQEIDRLLTKKEFSGMAKMKKEIRNWYDGYRSPDLKMHAYNTRSTLNFLRTGQLKSYWADHRAIKPLKYLLIEPVAWQLLNDSVCYKPIEINHTDIFLPHHIMGLKTFAENELWDEEFSDVFIQLLKEKGYFTNVKQWDVSHQTEKITVGIPNTDICTVLKQILKSFVSDPKELLDRLKAAVHELAFFDKRRKVKVDVEDRALKVHHNRRKGSRKKPRKVRRF